MVSSLLEVRIECEPNEPIICDSWEKVHDEMKRLGESVSRWAYASARFIIRWKNGLQYTHCCSFTSNGRSSSGMTIQDSVCEEILELAQWKLLRFDNDKRFFSVEEITAPEFWEEECLDMGCTA